MGTCNSDLHNWNATSRTWFGPQLCLHCFQLLSSPTQGERLETWTDQDFRWPLCGTVQTQTTVRWRSAILSAGTFMLTISRLLIVA
jgi:hypothetical protein